MIDDAEYKVMAAMSRSAIWTNDVDDTTSPMATLVSKGLAWASRSTHVCIYRLTNHGRRALASRETSAPKDDR